jgi:glycosyltransferase involved in cell wall biosynthesis
MSNNKSCITVVTVVKNSEKLIEKTILSVLNQTFKKIEYIIIDGGSTDKTKNIINKYKKKIKKIIFSNDNGIYEAMNLGIKESFGEWIIFLNSGDVFYNKNVLKNIFFQKKYKDQVIFGNAIKDFKFKKIKWIGKYYSNYSFIMPFSHQASFISTNYHKKNLYDKKNKITSDFIFFFNAYLKKIRFRKINNFISVINTNGISNNKRFLSYYELIKFFYIKKYFVNCIFCILYLFYIQLKYLLKKIYILLKVPKVLRKY